MARVLATYAPLGQSARAEADRFLPDRGARAVDALRKRASIGGEGRRPARTASSTARPSAAPPCASTYSTHAQRALVERTSARPLQPALASDRAVARPRRCRRTAAPSSGVLRLAQNGAMPSATGMRCESSVVKRDALVDVGVGLAGQADHHVELEPLHAVRARQLGRALEVPDARAPLERARASARSRRPSRWSACGSRRASSAPTNSSVSRSGRRLESPTSQPRSASVCDDLDDLRDDRSPPRRPGRRACASSGMSPSMRSLGTMRMPPLVERRITQ